MRKSVDIDCLLTYIDYTKTLFKERQVNILNIIASFKKKATPDVNLLAEYAQLQDRNKARMEAIKEAMGTSYILHPSHKKSRLNEPRPV